MRRLICSVIAVALVCALSGIARADQVVYSTTGAFSAGSSSALVGTGPASLALNGQTLTFVGTAQDIMAPSLANMGQFTATTSTGGSLADFSGAQFTLTITQSIPTPAGPQDVVANLSGSLQFNGSTLSLDFGTNTVTFTGGGFTTIYYPSTPNAFATPGATAIAATNGGVAQMTTLQGSVNIIGQAEPAPLPTTAGLGLVLLGGLGFGRVRRMNLA